MTIVPNSLHFSGIIPWPGVHRPTYRAEREHNYNCITFGINCKTHGSVLAIYNFNVPYLDYCDIYIADAAKQSAATGVADT